MKRIVVEMSRAKVSLPYQVIMDGMIICLCPSEECAMTIYRALKQAYEI